MREDAGTLLRAWIAAAGTRACVAPVEPTRGREVAKLLGVSERALVHAMAIEVGAVLVDHGWVRVLGGGSSESRADLASWNGLGDAPVMTMTPGLFVVAHDVLGGVFAMDGGALGSASPGEMHYFAPDSLRWEPLGAPYSSWLRWLLTDGEDVAAFYAEARWPGWEDEVRPATIDDAIHTWPPPWTREGKNLAKVSRRRVPAYEVVALGFAAAEELDGRRPPGPRRALAG